MKKSELEHEIATIFEPIYSDGGLPLAAPPHSRLESVHALDTSYWESFEFSTVSPHSRLVSKTDDPINNAIASVTAPSMLFWSGLRLMADSILEYHSIQAKRKAGFRYYPAILMTFCAGFEAFIRFNCEILAQVAKELPQAARLALLELEEHVERNGSIKQQRRPRNILDRYWLMLKYGYDYKFDRGSKFWQAGEAAIYKRNELVHYEVSTTPSIGTSELWGHMEAILLLLIYPSTQLSRTVCPSQFEIYETLAELLPLIEKTGDFVEQPIHKDWGKNLMAPYIFHCTFTNIDDRRYPPLLDRNKKPTGEGTP